MSIDDELSNLLLTLRIFSVVLLLFLVAFIVYMVYFMVQTYKMYAHVETEEELSEIQFLGPRIPEQLDAAI